MLIWSVALFTKLDVSQCTGESTVTYRLCLCWRTGIVYCWIPWFLQYSMYNHFSLYIKTFYILISLLVTPIIMDQILFHIPNQQAIQCHFRSIVTLLCFRHGHQLRWFQNKIIFVQIICWGIQSFQAQNMTTQKLWSVRFKYHFFMFIWFLQKTIVKGCGDVPTSVRVRCAVRSVLLLLQTKDVLHTCLCQRELETY